MTATIAGAGHGVGEGELGMAACIDECTRCHRVCMETVVHSLEMGGVDAAAGHVRVMLDCAQMCATSADFMLRGSLLHGRTCGVCAEVCRACEAECRRQSDASDQRCADECRRCAESCERMARAA